MFCRDFYGFSKECVESVRLCNCAIMDWAQLLGLIAKAILAMSRVVRRWAQCDGGQLGSDRGIHQPDPTVSESGDPAHLTVSESGMHPPDLTDSDSWEMDSSGGQHTRKIRVKKRKVGATTEVDSSWDHRVAAKRANDPHDFAAFKLKSSDCL